MTDEYAVHLLSYVLQQPIWKGRTPFSANQVTNSFVRVLPVRFVLELRRIQIRRNGIRRFGKTPKFNRVLEVVEVGRLHVHAKFIQAKCSGLWVIVLTEKKTAENHTVVATADSNDTWDTDHTWSRAYATFCRPPAWPRWRKRIYRISDTCLAVLRASNRMTFSLSLSL